MKRIVFFFTIIFFFSLTEAVRLKDMANVRGVRSNQLIGYGLVVGLAGTGDSKMEFTSKSVVRMLDKLGVRLNRKEIESKNVAAVLVTAKLPPFSRAGTRMDVTLNSIGDASDLKGGTLVQTPLRAANQQVFAVAQGVLSLGKGSGSSPTVARVIDGAMIEKDFLQDFSQRKMFRIILHQSDFTTAARVVKSLNQDLGGVYARAIDGRTVDLVIPSSYEGKGVEFLAAIESIDIAPDLRARVIINEKTGTVVMGDKVKISKVAISHGDLSIEIGDVQKNQIEGKKTILKKDISVGELVKAMNRLGVAPKDFIAILQNIKAAGALHGEIEVL